MEMLVVRAGYYLNKKRQAVVDMITRLWERLTIPNTAKVVTRQTPPLWWAGKYKAYGFHYYRYFAAWEEWKYCPAKFLVLVDIDVLPTHRGALYALLDYLKSLPPGVGLVTRQLVAGLTPPVEGSLTLSPSEGLWVIIDRYIPPVLLHQLQKFLVACSSFRQNYVFKAEGQLVENLPPVPTVCFPSNLLTIVDAGGSNLEEIAKDTLFIHPAGDIANHNFLELVFQLHLKYDKL